jgi:hypothetical protein
MTQRERFLRVGKMAQLEKLEAFLLVARENNDRMLVNLCRSRIEQVRSFDTGSTKVTQVGKAMVIDRQSNSSSSKSSSEQRAAERKTPKLKDGNGVELVVELERDIVL